MLFSIPALTQPGGVPKASFKPWEVSTNQMVMLSHVLARCHCSTSIPTKRRSAQRKYTTITVMRTGSGWDGGVPFSCRMSLQQPILLIGGVPKVSTGTRPSGKYLIRWWCCPIFLPDVTAAPSIYSAEECLKQVPDLLGSAI